MPIRTIVAVAIGPAKQVAINMLPIPNGVRKYINGFVAAFPHNLGVDYVIDYRECPAADLNALFTHPLQADYILCLSTTVVREAAQDFPEATNKPIIGIVSRPQNELFFHQANVCGVSAGRSDHAKLVFRNLLHSVDPILNQATTTVLYDPNYTPSQNSLHEIQVAFNPIVVQVHNPTEVQNAINQAAPKTGVLLLPVDWMFGSAPAIVGWASNRPVLDFWFVTDWVVQYPSASAFGGYGVPQETSGQYLAQQLDVIWNGEMPHPRWLKISQEERVWKASQTRADNADVTLDTNGPVIVR